MIRLFLGIFVLIFSSQAWSQQGTFQGRVDFAKSVSTFEKEKPVPGTLYLLTGSAASIRILSEDPFLAEVDFVQGEWLSESELVAARVILVFDGNAWGDFVKAKKPRRGGEQVVYPYRKFQVAAQAIAGETKPVRFKAVFVPLFF